MTGVSFLGKLAEIQLEKSERTLGDCKDFNSLYIANILLTHFALVMSIIQLFAGVACALGILFLIWRIAIIASRYMIRQSDDPVGLKLLTEEPSGVKVTIPLGSGSALDVWHRGSGQAVIILPESGLNASAYTPVWSFLCGYGFRVILPDTGSHPDCTSPEVISSAIQSICNRLSVKSAILLGHGFGAYQAVAVSRALNEQVHSPIRGIVSVSGFAGFSGTGQQSKFEQLFLKNSSYQRYLAAFGDEASTAGVLALQQKSHPHLWKYLRKSWDPVCSIYSNQQADWPIKVISSVNDGILPFGHARELSQISANSEVIHVKDGAGHMLIWEKPTLVVDQVRMIEKEIRSVALRAG